MFVDVDYPDLMRNKVRTILASKELRDVILSSGEPENLSHENILLQTPSYIALSCDLRDLAKFSDILETLFISFKETAFLFTAEVSLTYMVRESADDLIKWAGSLPCAEFALLEQIIPSGADHPFASTMLQHFRNLKTPLNSILIYPTLRDQSQRFDDRGWTSIDAKDLLRFWNDNVSLEKKEFVELVEDFDEWEEFILFCQHYFILHAKNYVTTELPGTTSTTASPQCVSAFLTSSPLKLTQRKFSGSAPVSEGSILIHGGLTTSRQNSSVLLTSTNEQFETQPQSKLEARMCHTLTSLANGDVLLIGGRLNPSNPLNDCWLYCAGAKVWKRVHDLPEPRYRHCAVRVGNDKVLVYGGVSLSSSKNYSPWLLWSQDGWKALSGTLESRFSSCLCWDEKTNTGVVIGGMSDRQVHNDAYVVSLNDESVSITHILSSTLLSRYGSRAIFLDATNVLVAGGVSSAKVHDRTDAVVKFNVVTKVINTVQLNGKLPLLSGFNMDKIDDDQVVIYGGGAVCFSFGSFWNDVFVLSFIEKNELCDKLTAVKEKTVACEIRAPEVPERGGSGEISDIRRIRICESTPIFSQIYKSGMPVLFEGNNLGSCTSKWQSSNYLKQSTGNKDRQIVAHISKTKSLNFKLKNFDYQAMSFERFIDIVFGQSDGWCVYLRSLSADKPKDKPSKLQEDFPGLHQDVALPEYFRDVEVNQFSSPLRISTPNTSMWLHYDVTANILCQIVGQKRVRLYPPTDAFHLSFSPGSSSSTIENIFEHPVSCAVHPIEFIMNPGDIVFIPALWLHATVPLTPSISINYFWKNFAQDLYAAGKDVYGNRDLAAYENSRILVSKIVGSFKHVPDTAKQFYLLRLSEELMEAANSKREI